MSSCKNEVGNRYGRLIVLSRVENRYGVFPISRHGSKAAWLCQCDCGNRITTTGETLRQERIKSCGCLRLENIRKALCKTEEEKRITYSARRARELVNRKQAKYGLSSDEQKELYERQKGICILPSCTRKAYAFDHSHVTGKFRGLLCNKCNFMLGFSEDNPVLLREAADYLEEHDGV